MTCLHAFMPIRQLIFMSSTFCGMSLKEWRRGMRSIPLLLEEKRLISQMWLTFVSLPVVVAGNQSWSQGYELVKCVTDQGSWWGFPRGLWIRLHPWNEAFCCSDKEGAKHSKGLLLWLSNHPPTFIFPLRKSEEGIIRDFGKPGLSNARLVRRRGCALSFCSLKCTVVLT